MLMVMDLNRKYTAILENATEVGYDKIENQIGSMKFTLPLDDPKLSLVKQLLWVELTDNENEYIGLYRVMPSTAQKDPSNNKVTFTAHHVLSTLLDSVIIGFKEIINRPTNEVLTWLLNMQKTKHWKLGKCDFKRYFSYSFENENGLANALFSIPRPFDESYQWTWDTQSYPWTLNLVKADDRVVGRIQEGYNMQGLEVTVDPNNLVNRIYPYGAGEGVNQLNIKRVNGGKEYIEDSASIKKYGVIETTWVDQRFTQEQSLLDSAKALLKKWKEPLINYKVSAVDLTKLLREQADTEAEKQRINIDLLRLGRVIMINTNDFGTVNLRIVKESKSDVFKEPHDIQLELGDVKKNLNTTVADLNRKQQINETYSQGATNILSYNFQDNCDSTHPAEIPIYFDDDVVHINTVELTIRTKKYRAYTRAVSGGGATVKSTSAGGATTQTSSSGGGSTQTSTSGGGGTQTSTSGGSYSNGSTTSSGGGYANGSTTSVGGASTQTSSSGGGQTSGAGGDHDHIMFKGVTGAINGTKGSYSAGGSRGVTLETNGSGDLRTYSSSGNHTHMVSNHTHSVSIPNHSHNFNVNIPSHSHGFSLSIPNHSHKVTIPNHSHKVNIPNHTHKITIPNHTHEVVLPNHTHPLVWGIYESTANTSSLDITVDGKSIKEHGTSLSRIDLTPYLKTTSGGRIARGDHEIKIKPNNLARIEAFVQCRVFIQSQLGGQL